MNYLKSEHLKFKRTILNKLIFIIPSITAIFAWIVGGFIGFQYMAFYWWYAFLLPGTIAILCSLSHHKEENAGKYYSVFSMPISLPGFEAAKAFILVEKLLIMAIFLAMLISVSNLIAPATVVYSVMQSVLGSIGIILSSIWQIPLYLYLTRKTGFFLPIMINVLLGIFLPSALGNTAIWWLIPHCWAAKLARSLMGIELNGTFVRDAEPSITIFVSVALSMLLFIALMFMDAKDFSRKEIK